MGQRRVEHAAFETNRLDRDSLSVGGYEKLRGSGQCGIAFASTKRVSTPARIGTGKLSTGVISRFLGDRKVRKIVVSSVVPAKNSAIAKAAKKTDVLWLNWKLNLGVEIDYPEPQSIGADRLANAAAVAELYGFPAVVVDFGTAVTFDIVSDRRTYIGGVIAPGLEAMTNFLYQRTALLRRKKVDVVATGGYAHLLARRLPEIGVVHPHLTLEGLRIIANLNDHSSRRQPLSVRGFSEGR